MSTPELFALSVLRALAEVALLTLFGQGLLAVLAGSRRDTNAIYQLFRIVTRPVLRIVRFITPKRILDRHLPFVAFFMLFWVWIFLAYAKHALCLAEGLAC